MYIPGVPRASNPLTVAAALRFGNGDQLMARHALGLWFSVGSHRKGLTSGARNVSRMLVAVLAVCTVVVFAGGSVARAEVDSWGPTLSLPSGSAPASDQILSSPTGALLRYSLQNGGVSIASFESGVLGPETELGGGELGRVEFLPDGTAVLSFVSGETLDLAVRLPDGQVGPVFDGTTEEPIVAFAVRQGEVLLVREKLKVVGSGGNATVVPDLLASSLAIGDEGRLSTTGTTTTIYQAPVPEHNYGNHIESAAATMDANGEADVVFDIDRVEYAEEVIDISRSASGEWSSPRALFAPPYPAGISEFYVAVAPGGRALLAFFDGEFEGGELRYYDSIREPGETFASPTEALSVTGFAQRERDNHMLVAAGGDGTLALAIPTSSCHSENTHEAVTETITAFVAPPNEGLNAHSIPVLDTEFDVSYLTALGAGDGQALVGVQDHEFIADESERNNVCGELVFHGEGHGTVTQVDRVALVGGLNGNEKTFGEVADDRTEELNVYGAGIDLAGEAAVTGDLAAGGGAGYAFYGPPSSTRKPEEKGVTKPSEPDTSTTSTTGSTTSATTSASTETPSTPPPAPIAKYGPLEISSSGEATVTLTAPKLAPDEVLLQQVAIEAFSGGGGARTSSAYTAASKHAKLRLIGRVQASVRLHSEQRRVLHLKLSRALLSYLRSHTTAKLKLTVTSTETGHKTTVKTSSLTVKLTHRH
jgi:hypothetical protein